MALSDDDNKQAKQLFFEKAQQVNQAELADVIEDGLDKMRTLGGKPPNTLLPFWQDMKLVIQLIRDYASGRYRSVPWRIIAALASAIIYFITPMEAMPDFIPFAGYIDDALVMKLALDLAKEDLNAYRRWQDL